VTVWKDWRHVVKLDPDREASDELLAALESSGTDAVFVGGTQGITYEKVNRLLGRLRRFAPKLPIWQEVSDASSIVDGVDGYAVPVVLNSGTSDWLIGAHAKALLRYGAFVDWSRVLVEGYLVLNGEAAVASLTQAKTDLDRELAAAYASAGEQLFSLPAVYVEYSGTYGDPEVVAEISRMLKRAHLFYGGGIDSFEKAERMGRYADTIVVGNALYRDGWQQVLAETVRAVK
jgi:putative glycerol-1-phosphate prenyltransferase